MEVLLTANHYTSATLYTLQVLISHDPNLKDFIATCLDDSCFTALHLAIIRHHNHIVRYLISKLGNRAIGSVNESGVNAAHVAASVGQLCDVCMYQYIFKTSTLLDLCTCCFNYYVTNWR